MDEQSKIIKKLKIAIACVAVVLCGISGVFMFLLAEEADRNAELTHQLSEAESEKDKWYASYLVAADDSEEVYSLKAENKTLAETISEQEKTINEQTERISELEAQLATASKPSSSSGSSGSSSSSGSTSSYGSSGSTSSSSETQSVTVYVTRTGEKYHRSGCRYLSNSKIPISLSNAKASGYTACSVCF